MTLAMPLALVCHPHRNGGASCIRGFISTAHRYGLTALLPFNGPTATTPSSIAVHLIVFRWRLHVNLLTAISVQSLNINNNSSKITFAGARHFLGNQTAEIRLSSPGPPKPPLSLLPIPSPTPPHSSCTAPAPLSATTPRPSNYRQQQRHLHRRPHHCLRALLFAFSLC